MICNQKLVKAIWLRLFRIIIMILKKMIECQMEHLCSKNKMIK